MLPVFSSFFPPFLLIGNPLLNVGVEFNSLLHKWFCAVQMKVLALDPKQEYSGWWSAQLETLMQDYNKIRTVTSLVWSPRPLLSPGKSPFYKRTCIQKAIHGCQVNRAPDASVLIPESLSVYAAEMDLKLYRLSLTPDWHESNHHCTELQLIFPQLPSVVLCLSAHRWSMLLSGPSARIRTLSLPQIQIWGSQWAT